MRRSTCMAVLVVLATTLPARAFTITYVTPDGSTAGGQPVNAQATFTTEEGLLTIEILNNLNDPKAVVQNISDLFFTLSTGETVGTISSSSGLERTVLADGTYTDGSAVATGWTLDNGATFHLRGIGDDTDGPAHTIIGGPNEGNVYGSANSSIAGNGPHNPFLAGTVTFEIAIEGLTEDSVVDSATFSFGTELGVDVPGVPSITPVPEPSTMALASGLALGLAGYRALKRRRS